MQIEKRDLVKCIILSLVTCGIYQIIWAVKLGQDAVRMKDANDPGTLEIVLLIFFPVVGLFLSEKKFAEGCAMKGIPHNDNSIVYLLLGLFGFSIVAFALLQNDLNKLVDAGYANAPSTAYYQNPNQSYTNPPYPNPPYSNPQYPNPPYEYPQNNNPPEDNV